MKKEVQIGVLMVYSSFFLFLLLQFSRVFIYYDDFGYLSLSYGNTVSGVTGSDYTFSQLITFIGQHYLYSSGRLSYLFLFVFLYLLGGLTAIQVFMAASVMLILILTHYVITSIYRPAGWRMLLLAVFVCLLYGTIGIISQRLGTYWYAAAFLYVVPTITFLLLAIIYVQTIERKPNLKRQFICIILSFFAAFSQEQWLVATISYIIMVIAEKIGSKHRVGIFDFAMLGAAVAGALPILTSPAVQMRMENNSDFANLSISNKVISNLSNIINLFFSYHNRIYLLILLVALMIVGFYLIFRKLKYQTFNIFYLCYSILILLYLMIKLNHPILKHNDHLQIIVWILLLYLFVAIIQVFRFLNDKKQIMLRMIFFSSVLTLACLVIVPEFPPRVLLPFTYLSFSWLGYIFGFVVLSQKRVEWGIAGVFILAVFSVLNLKNIYQGYQVNYQVLIVNDQVIRDSVQRINAGEDIQEIKLFRNPDQLCSADMVYNENFNYMIYWMNEYYDLPHDVKLVYEQIIDLEHWRKTR